MTIGELAVEYLCGEPCDDAISRRAVLKLFATHDGKYLFEAIRDLPSVKPQYADDEIKKMQDLEQAEIQKAYELGKAETGHWILDETDNSITCDKCGCLIWANDISNGDAHYCTNCGAKMESEER